METSNIWSVRAIITIGLTISSLFVVFLVARKTDDDLLPKQRRAIDRVAIETTGRKTLEADSNQVIEHPPKESAEISKEGVEQFIAFLDELEKENQSDSETTIAGMGDETPLSYEEELRQRFLRIKETARYKAVNDRLNQLTTELQELANSESRSLFWKKFLEYRENTYSALGLTNAEGTQKMRDGELSEDELEYMKEVGRKFEEQASSGEYVEAVKAVQRAVKDLHQERLDLLSMTDEEFLIALGRK